MWWRRTGSPLVLLLLYTVLTAFFTYPLAWHFGTHHVGEDGGDARVYLWNYWWVDKALTELGTNPFETDYIFYPLGIGLSLHTLAFLQAVLFVPMRALCGAVSAANLIVVWTFLASALGTYALARYLGASRFGAFLAGVIFSFCPYRLARLAGHYDLLGTEWFPLYTLVLLKALRDNRWSLTLLAGVVAAACGYTSLSYLAFLASWTLLIVLVDLWRSPRRSLLLMRITLVATVALVLLSPLFLQVYRDLTRWQYPSYPGSDRYAANLAAYLVPGPQQDVLGPSLGRGFDRNLTETTVFPGYLVLVLAGVALARKSSRFWLGAAAVFLILSLGSTLRIGSWQPGIPLPFTLVERIPLLHHLRAPSRFSILVMLCLAVTVSTTWTLLLQKLRRSGAALALTLAASTLLVAEYIAIPIPVFRAGVAPIYERIASEPGDFTVVEIPGVEQVPGRLMYHQTHHGKRIFIGTAARVPNIKLDYYFGLHLIRPLVDLRKGKISLTPELVAQEKLFAPKVARFVDIRYFVIDRAYGKRGVLEFLEEVLPVERWGDDGERILLRVREEDLPLLSHSIDPAAGESRMYFESGWSNPEMEADRGFRWANARVSTVLLRRPSEAAGRLVLELAPLEGTDQEVEVALEETTLDHLSLGEGWNVLRFELPPQRKSVERLTLRWHVIEAPSERDPRRLAARVSQIRFE